MLDEEAQSLKKKGWTKSWISHSTTTLPTDSNQLFSLFQYELATKRGQITKYNAVGSDERWVTEELCTSF